MIRPLRFFLFAAPTVASVILIGETPAEAQSCRYRRMHRPATPYARPVRTCLPQSVPVQPVQPLAAASPPCSAPTVPSFPPPSDFNASYQRVSVTLVIETLQVGSSVSDFPDPPAFSNPGGLEPMTTVCRYEEAPPLDIEPESFDADQEWPTEGLTAPAPQLDIEPESFTAPFAVR